ncbi:MAG: primosomal protein N', partial [Halanaerobiaceae bacterium]
PEHYSIQAAKNHNFQKYFKQEIKLRKNLKYPPFVYMVNMIIAGKNKDLVIDAATNLGYYLNKLRNYIYDQLGPSSAPLEKLRGKHRWQIILKFKEKKNRNFAISMIEKEFLPDVSKEVSINIDVDPMSML